VIVMLYQRRAGQEIAAMLLGGYAVVALALCAAEAFWRGGIWGIHAVAANDLQVYGTLLLAVLMTLTVIVFIRREPWGWIGIAIFWWLIVALMIPNLLGLGEVLWTNGVVEITRERFAPIWSATGSVVFTIGALVIVRSAHSRSRQPLLRNRLNYWIPVFTLILLNDALLIAGRQFPGNPLRWCAVVLAAFIITTHDPPDLREVARRVLTYVITTLVIELFYIAGFTASQTAFEALPNFNPLLVGAGIALLLSLIFTPLLSLVRRMVNRWLNIHEFHAGKTLHAYSEQISNILDMQRLANVAVGLIIEAMDITRGFLFLVDSESAGEEQKTYKLRAVRNQGERQIKIISLTDDNPVVRYFVQEQRPLLQYDLDLLPAFRAVSSADREWFNRLEAEVYLPIFSKREWIGMLALGAKISGNRYTNEDLVTLSALANQTAVALENARLVDNLMQLNTELRQAYRNLDKANRDLERLDRTKSDFISIASHELRTPLTTMIGYTEMLLEDVTLPPSAHEMLKGISKGTRRLHEIMDSMFDIAQIDTRTLQLHLVPVDVASLIRDVAGMLEKTFNERMQTLVMDIPPLPMIKADPNLMKKLFHHLLNNAVKFTPDGGKVTVTGRSLSAQDSELPNGGVEIVISDTGVGVSADSRDIIFSKFYQPGDVYKHSTSKTRFKGSGAGLGLALSKGIVEAHGGRIWVESAGYDEINFPGSQFHVVLPLDREEVSMGTELKVQLT
jgi:signal transduction histidine kinase